ncbi:MAG TPA: helix-turn-helix transcriptional regulator [Ferruginibacter sp.]|nr:helix-turn-helix transcriptional regulator [Ferruginibacter sp.]HRE65136.1 helix-turn-helix transcriptional regulator [Ferruginibacter sp.]
MQNVKDHEFLKALGQRLRTLRKEKGLSQVDVGVAMDNYAEQVGRIERGELNVTICTLKKLAETLHISLSDLMDFPH